MNILPFLKKKPGRTPECLTLGQREAKAQCGNICPLRWSSSGRGQAVLKLRLGSHPSGNY